MKLYVSNVGSQAYGMSGVSQQFTSLNRPGEQRMSGFESYRNSTNYSFRHSASESDAFGWRQGGGMTTNNFSEQSSRSSHTHDMFTRFQGANGFVNKLSKTFSEFKQFFSQQTQWVKPDPCPQPHPEPKACPSPQPDLDPCPAPKSEQCGSREDSYTFNSSTTTTSRHVTTHHGAPSLSVRNGLATSGSVIENVTSSSGNYYVSGHHANKIIGGVEGADTLAGGGGSNVFKYNAMSDSAYCAPDLLVDFKTGWDKIDLCSMAEAAGVKLKLVNDFTGAPGDTVIKYNTHSGRYFLAVDLTGNCRSDFLIKSTRPFGPEDVVGLS